MARGEVIGAYGLTEPGAGSDSGGTRTTARYEDGPDGGSWVIDGGKRFITNAGQAGTYIVTARTGTRDDGAAEISAFIVPADTPGFSRRAARGEAGPACVRDRRVDIRGSRVSRPPTCSATRGAASRRSCGSSTAGGSRSARWRSGSPRALSTHRSRTRRRASSSAGRSAPSRASPSWSPTWPPRSRRRAASSGGPPG